MDNKNNIVQQTKRLLAVIGLFFLGITPIYAQTCGNFGVPLGSSPNLSQKVGDVFNGTTNVGNVYHTIFSVDHNTIGAFPSSIAASSLCSNGDPYFINSRQGFNHPPVSLSNPSLYIGAIISGNISPSAVGFPDYASIELAAPITNAGFSSYLDLYHADASSNQRPMGSWICIDAFNMRYCTVYNYTSNPTCGVANRTVTSVSQFANYTHDDFCGNQSLLVYNNVYAPTANPDGSSAVPSLKNAIASANTGDTISWNCYGHYADPAATNSLLANPNTQTCSMTLTGTTNNNNNNNNNNGGTNLGNANCGRYATNGFGYNGVGYYSGQLTDIVNNPGSNAFGTSNFCVVGNTLVNGSLVQNNASGFWEWQCQDTSAVINSACVSDIRPSPNPICDIPASPYTNSSAIILNNVTQLDDNFCDPDPAHIDAGNTSISNPGGGGLNNWTWTCEGDYYNTIQCSAPSYGFCGSDNAGTLESFNSNSNTLCDNGSIVNAGTGTSSVTGVPFQWEWTCRGSTTDGTTDQQCSAAAQPASCGIAHQVGHETLTATSNDLCTIGTPANFSANAPINASNDIERTWDCIGGSNDGLLDVSCDAFKPKGATDGLCNTLTNNQNLTYTQATTYLQCTQGTPSVGILPNPSNNSWTYICQGLFGGQDAQCTINEVTNGQCTSYSSLVSSQPTLLCNHGIASTPVISGSQWTWNCNGENGGQNAPGCFANCANGQCNTNCTVNGTGANACSDGIQPTLAVGEQCNDVDGCICGTNTILNGTTCTAYTPTYPGKLADLSIRSHLANSGSVARGDYISFTLVYKNSGPDTATGAVLEYDFSDLLEDFSASRLFTLSGQTATGNNQITYDTMLFALGEIASGATGTITITGKVKTVFGSSDITQNAQITSLINDPNPLNNNKSASTLIKDKLTNFGSYIINPLLSLKSLIDRYAMIISWIDTDVIYRDILPGHERYMHIMTMTRMGIMRGYDYGHAVFFAPDKCASYIEGAIIVPAKIMYMKGDDDVYSNMYDTTPFADTNFNPHITNFVNRAYRKGVIDDTHITRKNGLIYLDPHRPITHDEMKEAMYRVYRLDGSDTNAIKPLFAQGDACVKRDEMARGWAHALRGNPQVVMGFNDQFLQALYKKIQPLSIIDRRQVINRIGAKLNSVSASRMYKLGLDPETLMGILGAAMKGESYNYNYDTSTIDNFFFEVADDKYDQYIVDLFEGEY